LDQIVLAITLASSPSLIAGSGTTDIDEFKQMYNAMPMKPQRQPLKTMFKKYDKNGDGDLEYALGKQGFMPTDKYMKCKTRSSRI